MSENNRLEVHPRAAHREEVIEFQRSTVLHSATAQTSGTLEFYDFFTVSSPGMYLYEWFAQKTLIGSVFNFIERGVFRVERTRNEPFQ